jgi:hypothetical protein
VVFGDESNIQIGSERDVWQCTKLSMWNWIHTPCLFIEGIHHVTQKRKGFLTSLLPSLLIGLSPPCAPYTW